MDGFAQWVERVKQEAKRHGRVFLLECFEGNERDDTRYADGLEVQDLSGFLLTAQQAETYQQRIHEKRLRQGDLPDVDFVFVTWEMAGDTLQIFFERARLFAAPERMTL